MSHGVERMKTGSERSQFKKKKKKTTETKRDKITKSKEAGSVLTTQYIQWSSGLGLGGSITQWFHG